MEVALYVRVSTTRPQQQHPSEPPLDRLQAHGVAHTDWQLAEAHL